MNSVICDICEQSIWDDYRYDKRLMRCSICGLVRAKVNPTTPQLIKHYQKSYFFGDEYTNYTTDRLALEHNFRFRLQKLNEFVDLSKSYLIEIGCAYGFFLHLASQRVRRRLGFDLSQDGVMYARTQFGLDAINDQFTTYKGQKANVFCMWDVIEHLSDPNQYIKHIAKYAKKDSLLALTTGDIGSPLAQVQGKNWRLIHPPTHLFYFDTSSITKLLRKHGFEVISITHPKLYRNLGSVFEQVLITKSTVALRDKKWYGCIKSLLDKLNFGINTFDIMEVVAKKL